MIVVTFECLVAMVAIECLVANDIECLVATDRVPGGN